MKKASFFNSANEPKIVCDSKGKKRYPSSKSLSSLLVGADAELLDLVQSKFYVECLQWDPEKRICPKKALLHQWYHKKNKEIVAVPSTTKVSAHKHQPHCDGSLSHRHRPALQ